jgi:hypothetical protein
MDNIFSHGPTSTAATYQRSPGYKQIAEWHRNKRASGSIRPGIYLEQKLGVFAL